MSRLNDAANEAELAAESPWLELLVDLAFPSETVYASSALHYIQWNGHTYTPLGEVAGIDEIREEVETIARPLTFRLAASAELVAKARDEIYQGHDATVRLAVIDPATGSPKNTPEIVWQGKMDHMPIRLDKGTGEIALNCEGRLRREPRNARMTNADLQIAYPGDTFFEHTPEIPGYVAHWGEAPVALMGPSRGSLGGGTGFVSGGAPIAQIPPGRGYVKPG